MWQNYVRKLTLVPAHKPCNLGTAKKQNRIEGGINNNTVLRVIMQLQGFDMTLAIQQKIVRKRSYFLCSELIFKRMYLDLKL